MKLTKKQNADLFNCHIGVGFIAFKSAENTIKKLEFFVGKNNEICFINDSIPSQKVNINQYILDNCDFSSEKYAEN